MLFHTLKYLHPTHYFQLSRKDGSSIFPIPEKLPKEIIDQLEEDKNFLSETSKQYDLSWQAINKGYTGNAETFTDFKKLPISDEYRFLRKYFNKAWVVYVLLLRLFSFNNPIREIAAFRKSSNTRRCNYFESPLKVENWRGFESMLVSRNPLVSIVIPTLNRYEYLKDVLEDLEQQEYKNFEIIIVDQSRPFQRDFYRDFRLDIQVVDQEERGLWLARNQAIKRSNGEYLLLFDDDSRVDKNWIINHLKCLDFFKADISSGVSLSAIGGQIPPHYSFFCHSSQLDTGNVLLTKDVFRQIGLFDRQFEQQRMGDGEFGLRAYLNGYKNISNPFSHRVHLKVGSGGLREMGSWDAFRTKGLFAPRPIPSVLYLFRKYFGRHRSILALLKTVPPSIIPYRYKKNKKLLFLGTVIALLVFPFILIQILISWRLATKKLQEGPIIERL